MVTSFLMRANQQDWFLLLLGTGLGISNLHIVKCPTVLQQPGKGSESAIMTQTEAQGDRRTEEQRDRGREGQGDGGPGDRGTGGQDVLRPGHL